MAGHTVCPAQVQLVLGLGALLVLSSVCVECSLCVFRCV